MSKSGVESVPGLDRMKGVNLEWALLHGLGYSPYQGCLSCSVLCWHLLEGEEESFPSMEARLGLLNPVVFLPFASIPPACTSTERVGDMPSCPFFISSQSFLTPGVGENQSCGLTGSWVVGIVWWEP